MRIQAVTAPAAALPEFIYKSPKWFWNVFCVSVKSHETSVHQNKLCPKKLQTWVAAGFKQTVFTRTENTSPEVAERFVAFWYTRPQISS